VAEPPGGGYVRASTTSGPRLPSSDLRDQLLATLRGSYTLERELGGGGMSRVFMAEETALGRNVVIRDWVPQLMKRLETAR
jgi:hypothetical protein